MKAFKRIAIVSNATKKGAAKVGSELQKMSEKMGVEATLSTEFLHPAVCLKIWMLVSLSVVMELC